MAGPVGKAIADNLARVRERISRAATASGRPDDGVRLVAVTKYVDAETAACLVDAGCRILGESRPQELWAKAAALADRDVEWHLVGALQRNKAGRTVEIAALIHSVDSLRLAETLSHLALERSLVQDVLLEVNISGEAAKHGFAPEELPRHLERLSALEGIAIRGLMGMASMSASESTARTQFATLRHLRDRMHPSMADRHAFGDLSMGMSDDFEAAIAEGATIVRIGSLLFEGVMGRE
jgi:pyridoxal phosphate enzyme (YggS family)